MCKMNHIYQIKEFGSFVCNKDIQGYVSLPESTFSALEDFILSNLGTDANPIEIMGISARKGIGKIITARNYVGIIKLNDGTVIEILPKIYSEVVDDEHGKRTKKLVIDMLKTIRNSPYKTLQASNVNVEKMNVFEIFIRMFIDEVFFIVKRGLKCNYETLEENANSFKGKMKFSQQIKFNLVHKERTFVEYDAYTVNRPENRLLKATLKYLYKHSASYKNRTDIKTLLNYFNEVDTSVDYKADFAKYIPDRNMKDYDTALLWSRVFLIGRSFTSFSGSEIAVALLFPMETLFESYVASLLKRELQTKGYKVTAQDKTYHLFDEPDKKFLMKPDIVVVKEDNYSVFVMDTKWKILSESKHNYGISQADMYQMYAYQKKYNATNVTLLYPKTENIKTKTDIKFMSRDGAMVKVKFIDLFNVHNITTMLDLI